MASPERQENVRSGSDSTTNLQGSADLSRPENANIGNTRGGDNSVRTAGLASASDLLGPTNNIPYRDSIPGMTETTTRHGLKETSRENVNGNTVIHNSGQLRDGTLRDTRFTQDTTVDSNGEVQQITVKYGDGMMDGRPTITLGNREKGLVMMRNVSQITMTKNEDGSFTGRVEPPQTALFAGNGQKFNEFTLEPDGSVRGGSIRFNPQQQPRR